LAGRKEGNGRNQGEKLSGKFEQGVDFIKRRGKIL
jgi:hypothetical protein